MMEGHKEAAGNSHCRADKPIFKVGSPQFAIQNSLKFKVKV
jgi:hypothetical protein